MGGPKAECTAACTGPMVSWPNTLLHGRGAAVGLAFYNVLGAIGGFISPYIVGRLSNSGSYNSSMYVQGAFNLAAALMVLGESVALMQPCMQLEWPPIE